MYPHCFPFPPSHSVLWRDPFFFFLRVVLLSVLLSPDPLLYSRTRVKHLKSQNRHHWCCDWECTLVPRSLMWPGSKRRLRPIWASLSLPLFLWGGSWRVMSYRDSRGSVWPWEAKVLRVKNSEWAEDGILWRAKASTEGEGGGPMIQGDGAPDVPQELLPGSQKRPCSQSFLLPPFPSQLLHSLFFLYLSSKY